jgi:hypothetical protein
MKKILALLASSAVTLCCGGAASTGLDAPADGGAGADALATGDGGPRGAPGTVVANGGTGAGGAAGAPGGSTSALSCGTASCVIPGESCCLTETGGAFSFSCVVGSSCPAAAGDAGPGGNGNGQNGNTATLQCTSAANCAAGTVCCVSAPNNGTTSSECKTSCTGDVAQLCDPNAATTGCAAAQPCSSRNIGDWGLPQTFATCGGKGN